MARYVFTQYVFGPAEFPAALADVQLDPTLRALGLSPEPATVVASWPVSRPTLVFDHYEVRIPAGAGWRVPSDAELRAEWSERVAAGDTPTYPPSSPIGDSPAGELVPFPNVNTFVNNARAMATVFSISENETAASRIAMFTKVSKVFNGALPDFPWVGPACAYMRGRSGCTPNYALVGTTTLPQVQRRALETALNGAMNNGLSTRGFFAIGKPGEAPLTVSAGGGSSMWVLFALAAGMVYLKAQSSAGAAAAMAGLGRVPPRLKASRLRKRATRLRHAGRYMEATRLERRANQITRSSSR